MAAVLQGLLALLESSSFSVLTRHFGNDAAVCLDEVKFIFFFLHHLDLPSSFVARLSPESLFLDLALSSKGNGKAQELGITFRLDVCGLYKVCG